ncbi:LysR substrate-binding domain-containing protein [Burkholderia plantarii]|uniref:Putative transcriptional regulator, LysR family n=1 Tax=Burkholderia plantarii TaxID=41899 RepID=A0A0B6RSJ9_BURPL|nr:LysR substrate-binding domain-containing protein [Burkholderia plantarii]AJK48302.1 putative transcriptional regulator, LysR family [Burkholderia plantarii]ALK32518.1 LysR family transcriptional regulator [Burkholderia plantarii]WLE61603.1 LysR family transcriptional regulator [Burkholderia plantarii]GLZ19891.1 LysR family transcriptional regulator [Burkholderia plantarii]
MNRIPKPRRLPPLNALRAFEAAARHLNFRLAAEEIGVTQGAVAQQVRHLEDILQRPLFERLPRGLALTADGRAYFPAVQRAFSIVADATDALDRRPSTLTISTAPSFASKWLIPRLTQLREALPQLEVRVIADERLATFRGDGVDIAIRFCKPPFGKGLTGELLFPLDVFAVAAPALLDGARPVRCVADLAGHALLHDAHDLWPEFLEALQAGSAVDPAKGPRFNQSSLAIDAAIGGQGIALMSEPLVERDIAAGRLRRVLDFSFPLSIGYYVVYPQGAVESGARRTLRDWLFAQRDEDRRLHGTSALRM